MLIRQEFVLIAKVNIKIGEVRWKMSKTYEDVLFYPKPIQVLKVLAENGFNKNRCYGSKIAQKVNMTYSHCVKVIQRLVDIELITELKVGRVKKLKLTQKGRMISNKIINIDLVMNGS